MLLELFAMMGQIIVYVFLAIIAILIIIGAVIAYVGEESMVRAHNYHNTFKYAELEKEKMRFEGSEGERDRREGGNYLKLIKYL